MKGRAKNMKNIGKTLMTLLGGILTLTLSSCGCASTSLSSSSSVEPSSSFSSSESSEESSSSSTPKKSDYYFVKGGVSEYSIVLPETASANLSFAASELSTFINKATGATLSSVTSSTLRTGNLYISLGATGLNSELETRAKGSSLGTSGYLIKTVGANLYIIGASGTKDEGVLNGVYDFLLDAIAFRAYSGDEVYYDLKEDVPLYEYDDVKKPSFDLRSIGYRSLMNDETYRKRMRVIDQYSDTRWGLYGHSLASALAPVSTLYETHPTWFTSKALKDCQLNYLAGDELETYVANSLISIIESKPEAEYFMMGQEDNNGFPSGDAVNTALSEWAGTMAGLQIAFCNNVIAKVEAWRTENAPTRDIKYVCFAYMATLEAPVKKDADGNYVPYSDKVIPNEKLSVYFTPIGTDFSKPLTDSNNLGIYENLQGYKALAAGQIMVYIYDTNFSNYLINFNNVGTVSSMYKAFQDNGVYYLYTQGPLDTVTPGLEQMRIYVESRLMYDSSLDYESLVKDFMQHYFHQAGDDLYEYYNLTFDRYAVYCGETGVSYGSIYSSTNKKELWSEGVVDALARCLDKAREDILPVKAYDQELYESLYERIEKEYITVLFLQLSHYTVYLSSEEVAAKKKEFFDYARLFKITRPGEGGDINSLFTSL